MEKFINQINQTTEYDAGKVVDVDGHYAICYEMRGASETFSIGQPVYDEVGNVMGWLGIGLYPSLDYAVKGLRVPCDYWEICLPTKFCKLGKKVYTYWQEQAMKGDGIE